MFKEYFVKFKKELQQKYFSTSKLEDKLLIIDIDSFYTLLEKDEDKAIKELKSLLDKKLKQDIIDDFFKQLLDKDNTKTLGKLNVILDNNSRDKAVIHYFAKTLKIDNNIFEILLAIIFDEKVKESVILNSFEILSQLNHNRAFELLSEIEDINQRNQAIIDFFNYLLKKNKNRAFNLLNLIYDSALRDKVIINSFEDLFSVDKHKVFSLLESIRNNRDREIIVVNFFEKLLILNKNRAIRLLNLTKDKPTRDKLIYDYIDKLEMNKSSSLVLINSIYNQEMKQKLLEKRKPKKEEIYSPIDRDIYTKSTYEAFELLDSIGNRKVKEREFTEFFLERFKTKRDIELFKLIQEERLKERILSNLSEELFILDINKTLELLDSLLNKPFARNLIMEYLNELLLNGESKVLEKIVLIENQNFRKRVIRIFIKRLFQTEKSSNILSFLKSISIESLRDNFIIILFNNFFSKVEKRSMLELLDFISNENLKDRIFSKFFNELFKNNKLISFELLLKIKDKRIKNRLLIDSIYNLLNINKKKTFDLYYSLMDNYKISFAFFEKLLVIDENEALVFLNSILDEKIKEKIVFNGFHFLFKKDKKRAFELLAYSNFTQLQQYQTINNSFDKLVEIDRKEAFKFLKQFFSKEKADEIIINNAGKIINVYIQNHKTKNKVFEIIGIVNDKRLKKRLTIDYFDKFFRIDSYKAIKNLEYLDQNKQEKVIVYHLSKLFKSKKKRAFRLLLKKIQNQQKKEEIIAKYFKQILQIDSQLAISLLADISNKNLANSIVKKFFVLFLQRYRPQFIEALSFVTNNIEKDKLIIKAISILADGRDIQILISLLNYIEKVELKEKLFQNSIEILAKHKKIVLIQKLFNHIKISSAIKEEIKNKYSYLVEQDKKELENSLYLIDEKIKEKVILKSYSTLQSQEIEDEEEIDTEIDIENITYARLAGFLIIETDREKHKEFFFHLKKKLKEDKSKDHSKLAYQTITDSKIFESYLFELELFIKLVYFQNKLKDFKEQKEIERGITKMLKKISKKFGNRQKKLYTQQKKLEYKYKTNKEFEYEEFQSKVLRTFFKREKLLFKKELENRIEKINTQITILEKEILHFFMEEFKKHRKIKNLYTIIPQIAKQDFELAQGLLKSINKQEDILNAQRDIFLTIYKEQPDKAILAYKRINNSLIKVDLSKIVLNSSIPDFENSFFIQAMEVLDSQNILKTPMELAVIAPRVVLEFHKEIESTTKERLNQIIEEKNILKEKRAEAKSSNDIKLLKKTKNDFKRLKNEIKENKELYEVFLEKFNISDFDFEELELSTSLDSSK